MTELTLSLSFKPITCCHEGCGLTFAIPTAWENLRRADHSFWYCPNGHVQHFVGETEAEKYKRLMEIERERKDFAIKESARNHRRAIALKGLVTKTKRRVGHGVCPCCSRSFQNLKRHMAGKHPDYAKCGSEETT